MAVSYNVSKIDTLYNDFISCKKKFDNTYYSYYKNSYIRKCTDQDIVKIKNKLNKRYEKISRIYKNINTFWSKYLNDVKYTDLVLAGKAKSGSVNASSVSSKLSKLQSLEEYKSNLQIRVQSAASVIGISKGLGLAEEDSYWENVGYLFKRTSATVGTAVISVIEGGGLLLEGLVDAAAPIVTETACFLNSIYGKVSGNEELMDKVSDMMREETRAFISEQHVKSWLDSFYDTKVGQAIKDNAYGFDTTRSIGNEIGIVVGAELISAATHGAIPASVIYGVAKSGQHIEENMQDEDNSYAKSIFKGYLEGTFDGLFYAMGKKGDKVVKSAAGKITKEVISQGAKSSAKTVAKKTGIYVAKTTFEVGTSLVQDATSIFIDSIFSEDTIVDASGNTVEFNNFKEKINYYYEQAGGLDGLLTSAGTAGALSAISDFSDVFGKKTAMKEMYEESAKALKESGKSVNTKSVLENLNIDSSNKYYDSLSKQFNKIDAKAIKQAEKTMEKEIQKANFINGKNVEVNNKVYSNVDLDNMKKEYDQLINWKNSDKFLKDQAYYQTYGNNIGVNPYKANMDRLNELEKILSDNTSNSSIKNSVSASNSNIKNPINDQKIGEVYSSKSQLKISNEEFNSAKRFSDASEIAIYYDDSKQYLYHKLRKAADTDPVCKNYINEINRPYKGTKFVNCPSADLNEKQIYDFLKKNNYITVEDDNLIKNMKNKKNYSVEEEAAIVEFTRWTGYNLAAYNRKTNVIYGGTVLNGADSNAMLTTVNKAVDYYNALHSTNLPHFKNMDDFNSIIDSVVNKQTLKEDMIVYRAVDDLFFDGSKLNLDDIKPGDMFNDTAHISTSAKKVGFQNNKGKKVQLEILAKEGTPAAYLESVTGVGGYSQQEILFGRNSSFKVLGYPKIDGDVYTFRVELVPASSKNYIPKISDDIEYSAYRNLFNKSPGGKTVNQIMDDMQKNGLMNRFNKEVDDMVQQGLYDGPKAIAEHDLTHVKNVLLYTMNIGNDMNLSVKEFDMLVDCAKYHDVGVVNASSHTKHAVLSAEKIGIDLSDKYDDYTLKKIQAIVEFHEKDDIIKLADGSYIKDDTALKEVCKKYGIVDKTDMEQVKFLGGILKDADAIDRTRFPGNIDTNYFRNKDISLEYLDASYDIREAISTEDLYNRINSGNYSSQVVEEVFNLMNSEKYPNAIIDHALKYYKNYKASSITEYAEKLMRYAK